MSSTRTHRQRWYSSQEGNDIRNPFLVHPPTHPLLPHQHQPHPNAVPPQAQSILQPPQQPPSPLFTEPSSPPPPFAQQPSSNSAHTPPPPPSSTTVHSSSPVSSSTSTSAIRQPIPTRLHHQQALLLHQNDDQQQQDELANGLDEAEEGEDEVENELQLQYDEEKEKKFDFYFGSRGEGKSSEVKQEGAVGVSLNDEVDLFGTSKSKTKTEEEEEISVSLMKWDKGKVVEKDPLEVRHALAQKKALLAHTNNNTKEPRVKRSSSKQDQGDLEAQRPNFLAQDLALGSNLPLDPKRLLPHALAQINKPAPSSQPHLPTPLIEDFYAKTSDLTTPTPTPTPTLTSTDPQTQTSGSAFAPTPHTLHLPPTAFSSRSCAIACLAARRLFTSRDARRTALGLGGEEGGEGGGKKMSVVVVEREKLDEGLERRLDGLLGWRV